MTEQTDAFHGQGGAYVVNPETGLRELIERTQSPGEVVAENAPAAPPPQTENPLE